MPDLIPPLLNGSGSGISPPPPMPSIIVDTTDPGVVDGGDGNLNIQLPDGSLVVDLSPPREGGDEDFGANLALTMEQGRLNVIAEDLLQGIDADLQSRTEWEATRARGIDLLGLKIESPRSDPGQSGAPMEGMSTIRDSILLEAVIRGQATAIGELLPAEGPVKIKHVGKETTESDKLAEQFEEEMNHYLVDIATEYYPDTKRMLFWTIFGGSGWKKVYSCPIRRRPVSESIDANDLIISNAATDLWNASRITHRIRMRPGVMRRMQFLGVYRDVTLTQPTPISDRVGDKKEMIEGVKNSSTIRPEDQDYTLYECYCELDLDEYAPEQFKGKSIPLPYRVTIDKDSREILEIHRNWKEDDEACLPRKYFVRYPYIDGMGIYGIGLVHVLGNYAVALTAAEREMLDAGMYATFPAFLVLKSATRQLTNEFRAPPGGGVPLDSPTGKISDVAMALPYKDVSAGLMALVEGIREDARRLGGTADLPIGEGKQDAPVGTTLALIEQATKVESAVHKGLHHAQGQEFALLKERFLEDPEAFWRHNPKSKTKWTGDSFMAALNSADLIPVADPNTPSHMHRVAKAVAVKQLQQANPQLYNAKAVDRRIMAMIKIDDAESLFAPDQEPAPDAKMIEAMAKLKTAETLQERLKVEKAGQQAEYADSAADRESRENIETMRLAQALVVHSADADQADRSHVEEAANSAHQRAVGLYGLMNPPETAKPTKPAAKKPKSKE